MTTRNIARIVIVVGIVAYLAYAHFAKAPSGAKAALAAPIASDAKQFMLGTLDFKACDIKQPHSGATTTAFCTPFSVPENRDAPNGRTIDLRVALIKSHAAAANSDIVVFLAGGPGLEASTKRSTRRSLQRKENPGPFLFPSKKASSGKRTAIW